MLDSLLDEAALKDALGRFVKEFPVLQGRVSRDGWNLAPYWKFPNQPGDPDHPVKNGLNFDVCDIRTSPSPLEECINRPFRGENDHLAFHLIQNGDRQSCLAATFDHRLFDARGAESFVNLFQQYLLADSDPGIAKGINLTASADLSQWMDKFHAGQYMNRKLIAMSKIPVRAIPIPPAETKRGFRFSPVCFDPQQTERIYDTAYEEAGYLMEMPYLMAIVTQTMHQLFESRGISAASYVVPVSIDMRRDKDIKKELFFNHTSMFFFQIPADVVHDRKALIREIKGQMYEQVQSHFPENLMAASSLLRIAPLTLLNKIFHLPLGGNIASFCFSHVSKCSYTYPEIMGTKITNIFHTPRVPVPPGMGIFFNSFNKRLNATITWLDGLLSEAEVDMLETELKSRLT